MKTFIKAIRDYDYDKVKKYLDQKPELANCIAKQPPKKDDGQSALQIAFKIDNLEIAELLIERGANINYIDSSEINDWNMPVFHDFIRGLINNLKESDEIYLSYISIFKSLISNRIDFYKLDRHKNTSLDRLITDTNILYKYNHKISWNAKQQKSVLSDKQRDKNLEIRLKEVYNLFLDEYLKKGNIKIDINDYSRNTGIYDQFKIDTFSMELLNSLLSEKQGIGLINFENKK